jgi:hypothetical protein
MRLSDFKIGSPVIVTNEFEQDTFRFKPGDTGVVVKITNNETIKCVGIQWDFTKDCFHTCGGTSERDRGYYIYNYNFNCLRIGGKKIGNIGIF